MPALSAAWMIIEPLGAVIATPSISIDDVVRRRRFGFAGCALMRPPSLHDRAGALVVDQEAPVDDRVLEFVPVMAQEALHRPRGGFAERADGVAFDLAGGGLAACCRSSSVACLSTMRVSMRYIQPVPSRHGVHWPQLSL